MLAYTDTAASKLFNICSTILKTVMDRWIERRNTSLFEISLPQHHLSLVKVNCFHIIISTITSSIWKKSSSSYINDHFSSCSLFSQNQIRLYNLTLTGVNVFKANNASFLSWPLSNSFSGETKKKPQIFLPKFGIKYSQKDSMYTMPWWIYLNHK